MIEHPQSQLQWEIIHITADLTHRVLNTQQTMAYPSEKQDKIPKNKPQNKKCKSESVRT